MYHEYTQEELRAYCRSCIESLEIWARQLIHEKMCVCYGENYINMVQSNGEPLVSVKIRKHVQSMIDKEPNRFKRPVDTLYIDHIIYFLCNQKWYKKLYKEALDFAYPQGHDEAREFLSRLVPIRNSLSHSNPISIRQAEQAICYSHDFIDGLKLYYKNRGEEQVWNVPRIIKITDSLGNVFDNPNDWRYGGSNFSVPQPLRPGEGYSLQVVVDPAFAENEYTIIWKVNGKELPEYQNSDSYNKMFVVEDVCASFSLKCIIISKKEWHKYRTHDGEVSISLTVLPPV